MKLYQCGIGMCPEATLYKCVPGACPTAQLKADTVVVEHPNAPEKGRVEMTPKEWNALIAGAKPVPSEN